MKTATSSTISVVIVDDEPLARENVRLLLRGHDDVEVVGEAATIAEARLLIEQARPDLVFLDIRMPHGDGFEMLSRLDLATPPLIVFVTAFDEFALRAFGARAIDYLLKPFDDARFAAVMANARERVAERRAARLGDNLHRVLEEHRLHVSQQAAVPNRRTDRVLVKTRDRAFFVPLASIGWIEAEGPSVRLHTTDGSHRMRVSISTLVEELDPRRFVRIHRGAIVNLDFVREFQPFFHGDYVVVLKTGARLRMSRRRRDVLERVIG